MTNRPKAIGTAAETAVVRAIRGLGFPHAERRALTGIHDQGDITGTPGVCWEVKGGNEARTASDRLITAWLAEAEAERGHAAAEVALLVTQRAGVGPTNAGRWWAHMMSDQLARLLVPEMWGASHGGRPVAPVRMLLEDACRLLRWAGYGTPLDGEAAAS